MPRMISVVSRLHIGMRRVGRQARATGWLLLCCLALATLHAQRSAELPASLTASLPELKSQTKIPILLPSHLPALAAETVYAHTKADADGYTIRLESDADCDGANACFLGILRAKRGGRYSFPQVVKLNE